MPEIKDMQIILVPVEKITPYWRNPRRNDKTVDELVNIILPKHGFNVPIVLDKNYVVVKGHARLKAAKKLGMAVVPCVISNASPEAIKADRIADNSIQEMSLWDMARLEIEWQKIRRPETEHLFCREDVKKLDVNFDSIENQSQTEYHGTSLDDYGSEDDDEFLYRSSTYDQTENMQDRSLNENPSGYPENDSSAYRSEDGNTYSQEDDGNIQKAYQAQERELQTAKKALKTICPYCGKTVYVRI